MLSAWKWVFLAALVFCAGCNRVTLNDERTVEVAVGTARPFIVEAAKKDQKIKVEVSSPGVPVSVYVCLEKDREAVEECIEAQRQSDKILATMEKTERGTLEATIPANNVAMILLTNASAKTANVRVRTTN